MFLPDMIHNLKAFMGNIVYLIQDSNRKADKPFFCLLKYCLSEKLFKYYYIALLLLNSLTIGILQLIGGQVQTI